MSTDKTNQSWGGRFSEPVDAFVARFTASVTFDQRLYRHDIMGSVAHATMLAKVGVLTDAERDSIIDGLKTIQSEIEAGQFDWRIDLEDVHMNIEARLTDRIGVTGKKLHTGRSRNDQVATDIRLWLRDEIDLILAEITRLQKGLLEQAEREAETIMPGFTHLQTAQPVTFGHHMLAWFEMLSRDYERLVDCRKRTNRMPLGSAALAGTTYPIDREFTAQLLGFDAVGGNSLDNVSDRDFAIEFCAAASIAMMHLSRFSEELVLWTSAQFQFIDLPDALAPTWLLREPLPLEVAEGGQPCHHGPLRLLAGPRRVETGWWPDPAAPGAPVAARDYYIAQNPAAELLWVYRERATSAAPSAAGPRWFLHGLYA